MNTKYYMAYGSNLNVTQMAQRCREAQIAGYGTLQGWRLLFRGSKTGAYLTIEPEEGSTVPVGVWEITAEDERALDHYEGFPTFYYKRTIPVIMQSYRNEPPREVDAMAYIMHEDRPLGCPTWLYVATCVQGYIDFRFEIETLQEAVERARKEAN